MAELVDALDSKSCIRKDVQVRFLFWALKKMKELRLFVTPFSFPFFHLALKIALLHFLCRLRLYQSRFL